MKRSAMNWKNSSAGTQKAAMWFKRFICFTALALTASVAAAQGVLTVIHPLEGAPLPAIKETFVFGEVTPGSTVTINGAAIRVHPKGGYMVMVPLTPGPILLTVEAI